MLDRQQSILTAKEKLQYILLEILICCVCDVDVGWRVGVWLPGPKMRI